MKKAQSKFYKKPVRSFADGGSMEFDATGRKITDGTADKSVEEIGSMVPVWGEVYNATRGITDTIRGNGQSRGASATANFFSPSSGVTNAYDTGGDTEEIILNAINPIGGGMLTADRLKKEYGQYQRNLENQEMAQNVTLGNKINNSIPSFKAPAYGRRGMKFKSKQC